MDLIFTLLDQFLDLYLLVVIVAIILSWLVAFNVLDARGQITGGLVRLCATLTEPVLSQIRRVVPPIQGLDFSPIILFIAIRVIQYFLRG